MPQKGWLWTWALKGQDGGGRGGDEAGYARDFSGVHFCLSCDKSAVLASILYTHRSFSLARRTRIIELKVKPKRMLECLTIFLLMSLRLSAISLVQIFSLQRLEGMDNSELFFDPLVISNSKPSANSYSSLITKVVNIKMNNSEACLFLLSSTVPSCHLITISLSSDSPPSLFL